jgi:hypothetical protein
MRVCDRCGKRITKEDIAYEWNQSDHIEFEILAIILPENADLCKNCLNDFIRTFELKIHELKNDVYQWYKRGEKK